MKGNLGKAIACFKRLGITPKMSNFQSKLVMQKTIYLLQAMGLKIGYSYGWYVRGNYSPDLTKDLYTNAPAVESLSKGESLTQKEESILDEFENEMGKNPDPEVLEIAAAYAYFFKECGMSAHDATIKTKEAKPFFTEMQFVKGINRGKALVFKPTKEDLAELKKEMAPWEAAADEDMANFEKKHFGKKQ